MAQKRAKAGVVRIGTSGWMYKDWGKKFYPPAMKTGFLTYLAAEFPSVEINTSFYHLPTAKTFAKWKSGVPPDFIFAVKISRYITHIERLRNVREPVARFLRHAKRLEEKLGPILIQLPPWQRFDRELLSDFVGSLQSVSRRLKIAPRFALEPRHVSWMDHARDVREILKGAKIAIVFPHSKKIPSFLPKDENLTASFVYVRFHGPSEFAASRYGANRLRPWAKRIKEWRRRGIDVFVYFNNDVHGHAIDDARTLKSLVT